MMKLNEVIVTESFGDTMSKLGYLSGLTGTGGAGKNLVARDNLINSFSRQYSMYLQAAGENANPAQFVSNYFSKNGWVSDRNQTKAAIEKSANNPKALGTYVYSVAINQPGGKADQGGMGGAFPGIPNGQKLSVATTQVIDKIQKLRGPENLDDLAKIAKVAMQVLYKQNPTKYTELYKEIMSGQTKKATPAAGAFGQMANQLSNPAQPEENPNLVRGTNESRKR